MRSHTRCTQSPTKRRPWSELAACGLAWALHPCSRLLPAAFAHVPRAPPRQLSAVVLTRGLRLQGFFLLSLILPQVAQSWLQLSWLPRGGFSSAPPWELALCVFVPALSHIVCDSALPRNPDRVPSRPNAQRHISNSGTLITS